MFLEVRQLRKAYERDFVVDGVSFGVEPGKIVTLLGPSGCGKTTTLRCIAGLEHPNSGQVVIDGEVVASPEQGGMVPPERRNVGMVFQSYAVWPHLRSPRTWRCRSRSAACRPMSAAAGCTKSSSWSAWAASRTATPAS